MIWIIEVDLIIEPFGQNSQLAQFEHQCKILIFISIELIWFNFNQSKIIIFYT